MFRAAYNTCFLYYMSFKSRILADHSETASAACLQYDDKVYFAYVEVGHDHLHDGKAMCFDNKAGWLRQALNK